MTAAQIIASTAARLEAIRVELGDANRHPRRLERSGDPGSRRARYRDGRSVPRTKARRARAEAMKWAGEIHELLAALRVNDSLSSPSRLVLLVLACSGNTRTPTLAAMEQVSGLSRRTILRAYESMEAIGWITRHCMPGARTGVTLESHTIVASTRRGSAPLAPVGGRRGTRRRGDTIDHLADLMLPKNSAERDPKPEK
jgi:hypothetical protein